MAASLLARFRSANGAGRQFESKRALMTNFCAMSLFFSLNHGCVTSLIAVASSVLSKSQGGLVNGVLYASYTLSSLLFANLFVSKLGSKWTIFMGLALYSLYCAAFIMVKYTSGGLQLAVAVLASAVSGVGAGGLWTAQAAFFSSCAKQHVCSVGQSQAPGSTPADSTTELTGRATSLRLGVSKARLTGEEVEKANALFSTVFVSFYLGCEVLLKLSLTRADLDNPVPLFVIFLGIAITTAAGMLFVRPVAEPEDKIKRVPICQKMSSAMHIARKDARIGLMAPYNFTFNIGAAFLNQYVNAQILEKEQIGYYASLLVASGFVFTCIFGAINKYTDTPKSLPMTLGGAAFALFGTCFISTSNAGIASNRALVVFLYIGFGLGRGVWESTMKAVFADFFADDPTVDSGAAFAHIPLQGGFAGAFGFLLFSQASDPRSFGPWLIVSVACTGVITYLMAERVNRLRMASDDMKQEAVSLLKDSGLAGSTGSGSDDDVQGSIDA